MPRPILFFIFIIIIDIILKSLKDKKKIDMAMEKRQRELNKGQSPKSRPLADLRRILEEEIEKERQRQRSRQREITRERVETQPKTVVELNRHPDTSVVSASETNDSIRAEAEKIGKSEVKVLNTQESKIDPKKDLVKGIIFSEILSKPKSLQNQRRSL